MASEDRLCKRCQGLVWSYEELLANDVGMLDHIPLGSLEDIRGRKYCPFCRLVASALFAGPRSHHFNFTKDSISVSWSRSRLAYIINAPGLRTGLLGTSLRFVQEEGLAVSPAHNAKVIDGMQIDRARIRKWVDLCQTLHGDTCSAPLQATTTIEATPAAPARVIDVANQCVVPVLGHYRYVALSYVWGSVPTVSLARNNREALMSPGSLGSIRQYIPLTITDAMDLVSLLGEKYLWVDTLCLVQDDEDDMHAGIQTMDIIYERALFTIIAASGIDANAGLPGVHPSSRRSNQVTETVRPGVRIAVTYELDDHLKYSKYNSRGWTYQEQILSARTLVFVDNQAYFRCRQCIWSEDTGADDEPSNPNNTPDDLWGSMLSVALDPDEPPTTAYHLLVLYYSTRELTKSSDAINAMAGIFRRLSRRMKCRFLEGLPTAALDINLLFYNWENALQRRHGFPSYSWSGWVGEVDWQTLDCDWYGSVGLSPNQWLASKTWIIWYERYPSGATRAVWTPEEQACLGGDDTGYRQRSVFNPHGRHIVGDILQTLPTRDMSRISELPRYPVLQFWTVAVRLSLSQPHEKVYAEDLTADVRDRDSNYCGSIFLSDYDSLEWGQPYELLVLSECRYSLERSSISDRKMDSSFMRLNPDLWDLYWVMLVTGTDGIAERRGLGQIYQNALDRAYPPGAVWKEIVLG